MCQKKPKDITQWFKITRSEWYLWILLYDFDLEVFSACLKVGRIHIWVCWRRDKGGNGEWFLQRVERCFPCSIGIAYKLWINLLKYKTFRKISSLLFTFSSVIAILYYPPPSCIALVFIIELDSWPWIRALPGGDCCLLHNLPVLYIFLPCFHMLFIHFLDGYDGLFPRSVIILGLEG